MSNSSIIDLVKPQRLDQIVGQDHLIAKGQILQLAIEKKRLFPMLLFGPSGCGKSSIARVLGKELK